MAGQTGKLAILVGGGPAPGINSVIAAATIRAAFQGVEVIGIQDGFEWLMQRHVDRARPLTIDDVSRIHFRGGSILGISRANPTKDPKYLDVVLDASPSLGSPADHHRRRRYGFLRATLVGAGGRTAFGRPRAEDDRQRPRPAARRRHLRIPDRPPPRRRAREEPDGGRLHDVALVLRHLDGPQAPVIWRSASVKRRARR